MSDIFISYAKEDRERARPIAEALEQHGWSVWWDRKIPVGKTFSQVIKEALDTAKCVIVLWSNKSVKSDWVQNEAAEGSQRKILSPVLIEDVEIPFEFRRIQAADLIDWKTDQTHSGFVSLVNSISETVGDPSISKPAEEKKRRQAEEKAKRKIEENVNNDKAVRAVKEKVYKNLWRLTGLLPMWSRPDNLTYEQLSKFSIDLKNWYFNEGGMYLSPEVKKAYADLQDELTHVIESLKSGSISFEDYEMVRKKCSLLRTEMQADIKP